MKLATCILFLSACLLPRTSSQWWLDTPLATTQIPPRNTATRTSGPSTPAPRAPSPTNCAPCNLPPVYNPVCGDNGVTYVNHFELECAQNCGLNVRILFHRRCERLG